MTKVRKKFEKGIDMKNVQQIQKNEDKIVQFSLKRPPGWGIIGITYSKGVDNHAVHYQW